MTCNIAIRGMTIRGGDGDAKAKFSAASWQLISVDKVVVGGTGAKGDFAEVAAHKGGWVIGETQLQQVLKSI